MEGVILYLLRKELAKKVIGSVIEAVSRGDTLTFYISLKGREGIFLNLSEKPVIYTRDIPYELDLKSDPLWEGFLLGWKIVDISQKDWDRVYRMEIEKRKEKRYIYLEFMGRFSNLIITDENNKIITALKPMGFSLDKAKRIVRGGFPYVYPEFKPKSFPWEKDLVSIFSSSEDPLLDIMVNELKGIGRGIGQDILSYMGYKYKSQMGNYLRKEDLEKLALFLNETYEKWKNYNFTPYVVYKEEKPHRVTLFPFKGSREVASLGEALSLVYETFYRERVFFLKKNRFLKLIDEKIDALEKKIAHIKRELELSEGAEEFLRKGELLKINMSNIKKGMNRVEVLNYYEYPPKKEFVEIDPELSPRENVDRYFKLYTKYKRGREKLESTHKHLTEELEKIKDIKKELLEGSELSAIEGRLRLVGILKEKESPILYKGEKVKVRKFISPDGFLILVGRSARENEMILKLASPNDYWLHVRDIPGSHVIIKKEGKKEVPLSTIKYAASIAAYFSKAREDTNVGVDYTLRKYVRPIKGGGPGFVNFREEKTIYVDPYDFKKDSSNQDRSF